MLVNEDTSVAEIVVEMNTTVLDTTDTGEFEEKLSWRAYCLAAVGLKVLFVYIHNKVYETTKE
jgi:hypothetical protein